MPVENFTNWYTDPKSVGLHYLLCDINRPKIKRQYSACKTLVPEFYAALMNAMTSFMEGGKAIFQQSLLDITPQDKVWFTIKNYGTQHGVSKAIYRTYSN